MQTYIHLPPFCMSAYTKMCSQYCDRNYTESLNLSVIWKISMITDAPNKFWSSVKSGLADVCGFLIFIEVCVQPRSWPLRSKTSYTRLKYLKWTEHNSKVSFTLSSTFACAFVFASNCNIASMGCCVKRREWVWNPFSAFDENYAKKTHSMNGA